MVIITMLCAGLCSCQDDDGSGGGRGDMSNWVDLGLPSGRLWAKCNVGASSPEDYGSYYAWGETQPKDYYDWETYVHFAEYWAFTKYCNDPSNGYNGFTDNLTTLQSVDDAATEALGGSARTPTKEEWQELLDNTTCEKTTMEGISGRRFTAANGNSIFLPDAGARDRYDLVFSGSEGFYWSASLNMNNVFCAWFFNGSDEYGMDNVYRYYGFSIRAVR